jgi:hypothetical protein
MEQREKERALRDAIRKKEEEKDLKELVKERKKIFLKKKTFSSFLHLQKISFFFLICSSSF